MNEAGLAQKRPAFVNYFIWDGDLTKLKGWVESFTQVFDDHFIWIDNKSLIIRTLEGQTYPIKDGYVILRGGAGEYWPIRPDRFEDTYKIET